MNHNPMEQAHEETEKIFRTLLPQKGLAVREEQISLCHAMLDALFRNKIALCDAGVGIGKTYAYLTACILWRKYTRSPKPVVISTSSIALQNAILGEYLPFLSKVFLENQLIQIPIRGIIRKGKERFVCDERLSQRLSAVQNKKKNPEQRKALDSLKHILDLDEVPELSGFDRRQVCVPQVCPKSCPRKACRYRQYLNNARSGKFALQICNHNYLLADAIHRLRGLPPLLHDFGVLAVDEAHKLPEAARQMTGQSFSQEDVEEFCAALSAEGYPYTAMQLKESCGALWDTLPAPDEDAERTAFLLTPKRESALRQICKVFSHALHRCAVSHILRRRLEEAGQLFRSLANSDRRKILYLDYDKDEAPTLCAASRKIPDFLDRALWEQKTPVLLTSGTLLAGGRFDRTEQVLGLSQNTRLQCFSAGSPFDYEKNCLLYLPELPPGIRMGGNPEVQYLAGQILRLVRATFGHTLALFPSYSLMGAAYHQLKDGFPFPLLAVWRNAQDVIRQFKEMGNAVLFAAGACWEGVDFPGDMVSSLILARLPFPVPDPLSEVEKEQYPSLQEYIQAVVVPEMQKKLRQGFGRAIRTETDTCVISILDCRAVPEGRYHHAALDALPPMPTTRRIEDVATFIWEKKSPEYFEEGSVFNADDLPVGQAVSHADCGDPVLHGLLGAEKDGGEGEGHDGGRQEDESSAGGTVWGEKV